MKKIFLKKHRSVNSVNSTQSLTTKMISSQRLLPPSKMFETINNHNLYTQEKKDSNIIRLNCTVNTYCTNVLFNLHTEIIKDEGSNECLCLTENPNSGENFIKDKLRYKTLNDFINGEVEYFAQNAIQDTQLSSPYYCNLKYHCGLDFFNNHRLRSVTFKTVNPLLRKNETYEKFNTIEDTHRHYDGTPAETELTIADLTYSAENGLHLYTSEDILPFTKAFHTLLKEENGWFGFKNKSDIKIYPNDDNKYDLSDISKPINNETSCKFIDMYPERDLFSFSPKYNSFKKRIEKNWNYCLTYPISSVTETIPFITKNIHALRVFFIDEMFSDSIKIYSMSKHGLNSGDYINLYKDEKICISGLKVLSVENEYEFTTSNNGMSVGSVYNSSEKGEQIVDDNGCTTFKVLKGDAFYYDTKSNFLSFSFKKIYDGEEVDYYVQVLSRVPNFKLAEEEITEKNLYENKLITKYQTYEKEFETHISKLSFAKNIYNDDVAEIVFTDDIDLSHLKDNLNRPLSDLYLTVIKNNKGNTKWYEEKKFGDDDVEFSHCFGKITCGFYLNPNMYDINYSSENVVYSLSNTKILCNTVNDKYVDACKGLDMSFINKENNFNDEVNYFEHKYFYGNLCEYSHKKAKETVIQELDYRFNTYKRENGSQRKLFYTEILKDDYDVNGYNDTDNFTTTYMIQIGEMLEGYYYKANYKIPFKTISTELEEQEPKMFTVRKVGDGTIFTNENNYLNAKDVFLLFNQITKKYYKCKVNDVLSLREFKYTEMEKIDKNDRLEQSKRSQFLVLKADDTIPDYAEFISDGKCVYVWRWVLPNGFDTSSQNSVETYPFTNGAFYISKNLNIYLRRQDPEMETILTNPNYDEFAIRGKKTPTYKHNNYYNEKDIVC